MKKIKILTILALLPLTAGCTEIKDNSSSDASSFDSQFSSDIDSSEENDPSSSEETPWSENEISLDDVQKIIEKGLIFKNVNNIKYYRKDSTRYENIEYKRYEDFYTLQGEADSYTDAWDEVSNVIGYYGFPSDGSINVFYDVLKADVGTQHAKLYTINDSPEVETELSEKTARKKLDDYENNLEHFLDETYYVLKNDVTNVYTNKGSLKAERATIEGIDTLHIVAEKDYTYLYQAIHADYDIKINISSDGSFSKALFHLNDGGIESTNSIDLAYGDYYDASTLSDVFIPENYFIKKIDANFHDIYSGDAKNTLTVGSAAYLIPHQDYLVSSSDFTYLPASAVDYWDINVISSSDTSVIGYSKEEQCFVALKPGKATLTIGNIYNPYSLTEVEVTVINAAPSAVLGHTPYNQESYVGEAFTNADVLLDVDVYPTGAIQDKIVTSSNEAVATAYINEKGEVMVHGVSEGYVSINVASKEDPSVNKSFNFHVVGELSKDKFVGTWKDDSYYSTYGFKMQYTFNNDDTGELVVVGKDYDNKEVETKVEFSYELDLSSQDIKITPLNGAWINEDLRTVHYYTGEYLKSYFTYGEYVFSINLSKVAAEE